MLLGGPKIRTLKSSAGFSIIQVLIVGSLVAGVATAGMVGLNQARKITAQDLSKQELNNIENAMKMYLSQPANCRDVFGTLTNVTTSMPGTNDELKNLTQNVDRIRAVVNPVMGQWNLASASFVTKPGSMRTFNRNATEVDREVLGDLRVNLLYRGNVGHERTVLVPLRFIESNTGQPVSCRAYNNLNFDENGFPVNYCMNAGSYLNSEHVVGGKEMKFKNTFTDDYKCPEGYTAYQSGRLNVMTSGGKYSVKSDGDAIIQCLRCPGTPGSPTAEANAPKYTYLDEAIGQVVDSGSPPTGCVLNGVRYAENTSIDAYQFAESVSCGEKEVRTCQSNGDFTGTFQNLTCRPIGCFIEGQNYLVGQSVTVYRYPNQQCADKINRTCETTGNFSGSIDYTSLSCNESCTFNGQNYASGAQIQVYLHATSNTCSEVITRTCVNGQFDGDNTYVQPSCNKKCLFGNTWYAHGANNIPAFSMESTVWCPNVQTALSCNNGVLGGNTAQYRFPACENVQWQGGCAEAGGCGT